MTSVDAFATQHVADQSDKIADDIIHWVVAEELCDIDLANHYYLLECFPSDSAMLEPASSGDQ